MGGLGNWPQKVLISSQFCGPLGDEVVLILGKPVLGFVCTTVHTSPPPPSLAPPPSINAWKISWTEEPGGLQSILGLKESDMT